MNDRQPLRSLGAPASLPAIVHFVHLRRVLEEEDAGKDAGAPRPEGWLTSISTGMSRSTSEAPL